ncbi:hypothetical protein E9993_08930 [Labilibacter sediminis]|nr:hypothetical protein E9993_08930 [Labilibacter sediminis]
MKNIIGWKTNRKIVVFAIDDYGNVRISSQKALKAIKETGVKLNLFDRVDALENRQDLEQTIEAATSVTDKNGNYPVLTLFSVPCNIDFEKMADDNFKNYHYELLTQTFEKRSAEDPHSYEGVWDLWLEGMEKGVFVPQFHGREHFNLKVFEEKLDRKDSLLLTCLKNSSNISLPTGYSTISYTAAFKFWHIEENKRFKSIIEDGLNAFEEVFGFRSNHFAAPGFGENRIIHPFLKDNGIKFIDNPLINKEHQGKGKFKTILNYTGKKSRSGIRYMVRNVIFEPIQNNHSDWVGYAMKQIDSAFSWKRPAIISSHRVNFVGQVNPQTAKKGIADLKELFRRIKDKWPDVEFMSADKLGELIASGK